MRNFKKLTEELGILLEEKNAGYGDSFNVTETILKALYPTGITPDQYKDLGLLIRISDKMKRIASGATNDNNWQDIAGYGILGQSTLEEEEQKVSVKPQPKLPSVVDWKVTQQTTKQVLHD
jgi:hypothetical protein